MKEAILHAFKNYSVFRGRTSRRNFWLFVLFLMLLNYPAGLLDHFLFSGHQYVTVMAGLFTVTPLISSAVRRAHDVGRSGWWLFFPFAALYLWVQESGPLNQYEL